MKKIIIIIAVALVGLLIVWRLPANTKEVQETKNENTTSNSTSGTQPSNVKVVSAMRVYFENTAGYYVRPNDGNVYPGVIMIHEWWGLNEYIKEEAEKLAQEGYQVLAVDLYNGEVAETSDRARKLSGGIDQARAQNNLKAAAAFLRQQDASKLASLGWCFGGGQSLNIALSGVPFDATVIYYGRLNTNPVTLSTIKWPVLGIFGAEDTSIPVTTVSDFKAALDKANVSNEIYVYDGVGHAFANPSGANYSSKETQDAWQKTLTFLRNTLKQN